MTDREHIHPNGADPNRGFVGRQHPDGHRVYMYWDDPGTYFDRAGFRIPNSEAKAAGCPVDEEVKQATKKRLLKDITAKAEAQLNEKADELEAMTVEELLAKVTAEPDVLPPPLKTNSKLITERTGTGEPRGTKFHLMDHIGGPLWNVLDQETSDIVLERVEKAVALDFIICRAEEAAARVAATSGAEEVAA